MSAVPIVVLGHRNADHWSVRRYGGPYPINVKASQTAHSDHETEARDVATIRILLTHP
jgi:hypothetical protein